MAGRVFFVVILASLCYVATCKKLYVIVPNTSTCKVLDYTYVKSYTCRSKNVNRTLNLGSREIIFQPGVSLSNYYSHVVVYRKFTTIYRQFMVNVQYDSCAYRAGNLNTITQYFNVERRRKYGNLFDPCPLSGRRYEYNVPVDAVNNTLEIIPSGEYRVDTTSYTIVNGQRKNTTLTQDYGEVKYTTAEQWKK